MGHNFMDGFIVAVRVVTFFMFVFVFLKQIFMFRHCYNSHHELLVDTSYRFHDKFTTQRRVYLYTLYILRI